MMDDEKMDELIRRAAADYNRPPATPRDQMWEAIRAARAGHAPSAGAAPSAATPAREHGAPRVLAFPVRHRSLMAAAAVALLAVGIGIGRLWPTGTAPVSPVRSPDSAGPLAVGATPAPDAATPPVRSPAGESTSVGPARLASGASEATPAGTESTRLPASGTRPSGESRGPIGSAPAYQIATLQHLARAEALLTSYRAEARAGKVDAELSAWARDLLSSTRLLLDSPAARDPRRRQMLEDLELVLVQMVHLAPDSPAEERDLIDRAIERGDVMTRLRSTIPAGAAVSGS